MGCSSRLLICGDLAPHVLEPETSPAQLSTGPWSVARINLISRHLVASATTTVLQDLQFLPLIDDSRTAQRSVPRGLLVQRTRNLNDVLLNLRRGFLTLMLFVRVKMLQDWHAVVCVEPETFIHVREFMTRTRSLNTMSAEPFDLLLKPYALKSRTCLLNSFNKRLQKRLTTETWC